MKKYYLLLLFVTSFVSAQIVNIPDANFKAKLISASTSSSVVIARDVNNNPMAIDTNLNGEIEEIEALAVYGLFIPNSNISDLTGIQYFTNLKNLFCNSNPITTLDLTGIVNLETLSAYDCMLTNLNVNSCINLGTLTVYKNNLETLNVSGLVNLRYLHFENNFITTINLQGLPLLEFLTCSNNLLNVLDVNQLNTLTYLSCFDNLLINLNVSSLVNLTSLQIGNPGLNPVNINTLINLADLYFKGGVQTTLNLSNLTNLSGANFDSTNLIEIDASNNPNLTIFSFLDNPNLTFLNLKTGIAHYSVEVTNCPNLSAICTNEEDVIALNASLLTQGNNNIMVTSYCSFTPGGSYNTITGIVKLDANNNGCDDSDLPMPNIKININSITNQGATFTNASGAYSFYTDTGNFTLTPNVENLNWFNFNPETSNVVFTNSENNVTTQNFCITPNGIHPDLEVVIAPVVPARPGFDAIYKIVYKNKGNQTVTGYVNFTFNDVLLDFVSASVVPTTNSNGTMNWVVPNISPFQSGSILVTLNVNSPQETPAVNIGDILAFNAFIDVSTDDNWADNTFVFTQTVVGSYDPNDITCLQGNALATSEIGKYLHYNIRFENTGTAPAENIVVKNEIDLAQYDIQSLQIMESSHPVTVKVTGNIAEFIFQNIDLDTGGHGNILLKLKSNAAMPQNEVINSADIYFDYNFPIFTNDEQTVFADLSKDDFTKEGSIQVYPNPTENVIHVKAEETINAIQLFDVQGRLLMTKMSSENIQAVDLSNYKTGVYFISVSTSSGKSTVKVIKK